MKMVRHIFAVPVLVSMIWTSAAAAQGPRINFSGCVRPAVPRGCLVVHSGEVLFNVSAARPRPGLNRWIAGSGIRAPGPTICTQGVQLTAIRWHYVRRPCPRIPTPLPSPPHRR